MSERNIYAPAEFKKFLTCARVKSIAKYIDDFDDNPCGDTDLYFTNQRKDFDLDFSNFEDTLSIIAKGHILVTQSQLVREVDYDEEVVLTITKDNIDEAKSYIDKNEYGSDDYVYQSLSASLYLTDITITDKNNDVIASIKDTDSEMVLIRGTELKENNSQDEYSFLRRRVFEHGFKNMKASCKRIISHYNLREAYEYILDDPCETCEDTCCDYDWGKPVEIEYGWIPFTLSDVDKTLVLNYINFIKDKIKEVTDSIIAYRKEKGRITYDIVRIYCSFEVSICRYFGAIAYCNAISELGLKINPKVLDDKIIKKGLLYHEDNDVDFKMFIDFCNLFDIDIIKELEIPKYLIDLYHKNNENLE